MAKVDAFNLGRAKKDDEYYTRLVDIETEMKHYREQFKGKSIFCNCDDPEWSNFWKYFEMNFEFLQLKRLVATHYDPDNSTYKLEFDGVNKIQTPLIGNGDFRNQECIDIMKDCDIVITNPPFSLFREYIAQLIEYNKSFLIIGRETAVTYKEVFTYFCDNKVWMGYSHAKEFLRPDGSTKKFGNVIWYTNLDTTKRHEELILFKHYDESEYLHYDNFDGIDIDELTNIPCDYYGVMGVPQSYMMQYNPEQFEIVGYGKGKLAAEIGVTRNYRGRTDIAFTTKDGKNHCPFARILIRRKQ